VGFYRIALAGLMALGSWQMVEARNHHPQGVDPKAQHAAAPKVKKYKAAKYKTPKGAKYKAPKQHSRAKVTVKPKSRG
jgi:hypothetical protein